MHFVAFGKLCWLIFKQNKKEEEETREGFLASAKKKRKEKCLFNARVFVDFKWILKQNRVKKTHFHPTKLMTAPLFSFFFNIFCFKYFWIFFWNCVCVQKWSWIVPAAACLCFSLYSSFYENSFFFFFLPLRHDLNHHLISKETNLNPIKICMWLFVLLKKKKKN